MEYKTIKEISSEWGITPRRVQILCSENRVDGALKIGGIWLIPNNATKPYKNKSGPK